MGKLVLITLPIGNLKDITLRAKEEIERINHFAVEDTRSFISLLSLLGISREGKEIFSFHDHSDKKQIDEIILKIKSGLDIAVASEAGSPLISDPAYPLISRALLESIEIESVSGITSVITALELSGLPPTPFHFHGFNGREKGERESYYRELINITGTHILFESPHRIIDAIDSLGRVADPLLSVVLCRELTKKFQSIYRFKLCDWEKVKADVVVKGEMVLLFYVSQGAIKNLGQSALLVELSQKVIESGGSSKSIAKLISQLLKTSVSEIYDQINKNRNR